MANLLTCLVVALWIVAMAILSVQNAESVSLQFLGLQSIQMPIGVVLGMSASVGVIGGALAQILWHSFHPRNGHQ
ncbi:MAG: DUF1049 domain-containing protein [Oscillatoriaceae bacterium SKW80]|nr:DUF1049 domain-containing protein [Oscillatoriaceae bacterium SKYG93]MCX8120997.1 DUF1049 domain-containing protein [Oscillatoriaceae bacterium SKW80]MDW8452270.1 DUF1049 domain-containing protein [Oscillatoriaceae cyanobacterium SKYGB_i_bin93]HIK26605.1 DUF1049 domain-containing protein [Oscillatoriaceae cyanobacterium M7585_C2015_266]